MINRVLFFFTAMLAIFIQSLVGFGGNPIAMPPSILLVGVEMAKPVLTILACMIGLIVTIRQRKHINWRELFKMTGVMLVGVILGIVVFKSVQLDFLLIAYALVIIGIGVKKLFFPSEKDAPVPLQYAALGLAGLMQGLFVSGGSFLAVYSVARLKDQQEFRATSNAVWGFINLFMIATYFFDGTMTPEVGIMTGICVVPALIVAWLAGILSRKINRQTFLKAAYIIIMISGAMLLVSHFFK